VLREKYVLPAREVSTYINLSLPSFFFFVLCMFFGWFVPFHRSGAGCFTTHVCIFFVLFLSILS